MISVACLTVGCNRNPRNKTTLEAVNAFATLLRESAPLWDARVPRPFRVIIEPGGALYLVCTEWQQRAGGHCGIACRHDIGQPREAERVVISCRGVQCDDWRGDRASYSAGV